VLHAHAIIALKGLFHVIIANLRNLLGWCVKNLVGFVQTARHRFQATVMFAKIVDTQKVIWKVKRNE